MLIQYNITTKRERWSNSKMTNIFNISQNGLRREPEVNKHVLPLSHELGESMEALPSGPVAQIVWFSCISQAYSTARLGEAWRFRRTFERGQALMKAQDAWCLKARAAASTGTLSLLKGEEFPSDIELDVIVGMILM
jgi:hypothetical protein